MNKRPTLNKVAKKGAKKMYLMKLFWKDFVQSKSWSLFNILHYIITLLQHVTSEKRKVKTIFFSLTYSQSTYDLTSEFHRDACPNRNKNYSKPCI